ncbi:MAG: N-acetylglucosamine-6-phosphate deacetylase [Actinomycetota bacterium]
MTVLRARAVLGHEHLGAAEVRMSSGRIESVAPIGVGEPEPEFGFLVPGFIDWQVNGRDDLDLWTIAAGGDADAFDRLGRAQLASGVTSWLPTLVSAPRSDYAAALRNLELWRDESKGCVIGVHLEGPFLGEAPGAHRRDSIVAADREWVDELPDVVRLVTVAAENPGITDCVKALSERGVRVSIGHSRPDRRQFGSAVECGATSVTHLFNAMSGLDHRRPGLAAWAMLEDRLWCGLIADGVHVAPEMIALTFRMAAERITLVTDSVGWRVDGSRTRLVDGAPRLTDGTLAGSALSMDEAIRVCVNAGVPWSSAVVAATTNVADFLGLADRGRIEVGRRADLVAFDSGYEMVGVWSLGERVR